MADINTVDLKPGDLENADIDFYEVNFYPVIYVNNSSKGELGAIALDGRPRTFPLTSLYSYNSRELSMDEFFKLFPGTKIYFFPVEKKAA